MAWLGPADHAPARDLEQGHGRARERGLVRMPQAPRLIRKPPPTVLSASRNLTNLALPWIPDAGLR